MKTASTEGGTPKLKDVSPYKLTEEQQKAYDWLKDQRLNVDENTLNYWARKYPAQRLVDVVTFAYTRLAEGQQIRNMGGWIHKLLKEGATVVTDDCRDNRRTAQQYAKDNKWASLQIYEKYVKDKTTGDDLPLTLPKDEFYRALEALYQRIQLYTS